MVSKYQGRDPSYNPFADAYFYSSTTAPPIEEKSIYIGIEEVSKGEQIAIEKRLSKALFDFITSGSIENRKIDYPYLLIEYLCKAHLITQEYQRQIRVSVHIPQKK